MADSVLVGSVAFDLNIEEVNRKILAQLERNHQRATVHLERQVKKNLSTSGRGGLGGNNKSQPGGFPHADRGFLRQRITHGYFDHLDSWVGPVGVPYARIQELGGVITPKVASALTVPISDDAKRWLKQGNKAGTFKPKSGGALIHIRRRGKPPLLVERKRGGRSAGAHFVVHFLLTRRVRIPARPYLQTTLEQEKDAITALLTEGLE